MAHCLIGIILMGMIPLAACTVGVFSAPVMTEGRPVIWKNRDVENPHQAVAYFSGAPHSYVALIWAGDTSRVWAGLNDAGFGIMNSNSTNIGAGAPGGLGDGEVMKQALQTCATVDQFESLLVEVGKIGLTVPCNFGVLDSTGATAFFEAGAYSFVRWNTVNIPEGYMVRANFSLSADTTGRRDNARYLRARQLVDRAIAEGSLSLRYLTEQVAADLGAPAFDPYPLPYEGRVGNLPWGFLPVSNTINRTRTRAAVFIVGRRPDEPVEYSLMWTMLTQPVAGIPVPVWVRAETVPGELQDCPRATLCDAGLELRSRLYPDSQLPDAIDSYRVAQLAAAFAATRSGIIADVEHELEAWGGLLPEPGRFVALQQSAADRALMAYAAELGFRTAKEGVVNLQYGLQVQTDPKTGGVRISFAGNPQNQLLSFYSLAGRLIARFDLTAYRQPGSYSFQWQPGRLPDGLYIASLQADRRQSLVFPYFR